MKYKKRIIFKQIGCKVAYYRSLLGLTQQELATAIGVSEATLGRLERGNYNNDISLALLLDITEAIGIDIGTFFEFSIYEKSFWEET